MNFKSKPMWQIAHFVVALRENKVPYHSIYSVMLNESSYVDIESRRKDLVEAYYEIWRLSRFPNAGNYLMIFGLVAFGWILSFVIMLLVCDFSLLLSRKPNKAVFYALFNEKLRKVFRNQRPDTFSTIAVGVERILTLYTPEEPTVLLFLVPRGSMPTAQSLVILLTHCLLSAWERPAALDDVAYLMLDGAEFRSNADDLRLAVALLRRLSNHGVAAVFAFDRLHPQVARALVAAVPMTYAPFPQSVLMLIADVGVRFDRRDQSAMSANEMGRVVLRDRLGAYFGESELSSAISAVGSRCVFVNPEDHPEDFEA